MKKIYFILATASLLFSGCNKLLDELPDNQVEIQTAEDVRKLLVNAYSINNNAVLNEYSSDNIGDYGPSVYTWGLISGQLAYWQPVQEYFDNDGLYYNWQSYYNAINHANKALEAIQELGGGSEFNAAKGEALLARAYAHFELANTFCLAYNPTTSSTDLGIPYMLHTEKELSPKYPRGTVAQVYDLIDKDIQAGLPLIDDNYYETPKYHFNKRAANAFAARFYLYYQQWQKAVEAANVVLTTNAATTKTLVRQWSDFRDAQKTGIRSIIAYGQAYARESEVANLMLQPVYSELSTTYFVETNNRFSHAYRVAEQETFSTTNLWDPHAVSKNNGYDFYWFMPFTQRADLRDIVLLPKFSTFKDGSYTRTILVPFTTLGELDSAVEDLNIWTSKYLKGSQDDNPNPNGNTFTKDQIINFYNSLAYSQSTPSGATQKKQLHPSFTLTSEQESLIHYVLQCRRILTMHEGLRWQDIKRYGIEVARYQHTKEERDISTIQGVLAPVDVRRAIQLPGTAIGAGMQPNPR